MFSLENRNNTFKGIGFVAIFAFAALAISDLSFFKNLQISPLIIGIVLGIIYANTLRHHIPSEWGYHFFRQNTSSSCDSVLWLSYHFA